MKYRIIGIFLVCLLLVSSSVYAINFSPEQTYDSVVVVNTDSGVGSGFFISESVIVTNAHVVDGNETVTIDLYDGSTVKGTVIKEDDNMDLALIQVRKQFTPLELNENELSIGQEVYAIGAPKDMPYTMTKGIISALDREIKGNRYIQVDASVNSGNSGGPLVDDDGKVIGVITLKASGAEGIGFAITVEDLNNFVKGVDIPDIPYDDEPSQTTSEPQSNEAYAKLLKESDTLKLVICISVILNIVLSVLLVCLLLNKKRDKVMVEPVQSETKDEFDFDIEIEEL